jgi:hypothetical protein
MLTQCEKSGIWDAAECGRDDAALIAHWVPPSTPLPDAARGYCDIFATEKREHSDPTPYARGSFEVVARHLRPGEAPTEAARCYDELFRFEKRRDIDPSKHAREAYHRVAESMLVHQTRWTATQIYMRDPEHYEQHQQQERAAWEARAAELERQVASVNQPPSAIAPLQDQGNWIVANGVRIPKRMTSSSS